MRIRPSKLGTLLILLLIGATGIRGSLAAEPADITVSVSGSGATIDEAKADAIKNALQYALKQLVIVERVISGNKVLKDKILSTSNGYIEKYKEIGVVKTEFGFRVDAEITVSASRIENFIGVVAGGGGEFNGTAVNAEEQRRLAQEQAEELQRQARGEIFDRLFESFPWNAFNIKLLKIRIAEDNPNILDVEVRASYKPEFLKALTGTLEALSIHECSFDLGHPLYPNPNGMIQQACPNAGAVVYGKSQYGPVAKEIRDTFCMVSASRTVKCYVLEKGDYCKYCRRFMGNHVEYLFSPLIFGRFVDSNGTSALTNGGCIRIVPNELFQFEDKFKFEGSTSTSPTSSWAATLYLSDITLHLRVKARDVNLKMSKYFIGIVGNQDQKNRHEIDLAHSPNIIGMTAETEVNACRVLDDAVHYYILSH